MTDEEVRAVLDCYRELWAGVPDHIDEVVRIAGSIVQLEQQPHRRVAWAGLPDVDRAQAFDAAYPRARQAA
jgi:hypothetical protein